MQPVASWRQKWWLLLAVVYTRYLLGGAFVFASLIKIKGHRFALMPAANAPLHSPERLFETLYQSGLYWQFLGFAQLVAGLLLLTQRYALLGALLFLPIIANVYVITISYQFGYTSIITGAMLLATVGLLGWDWPRLRVVINQPALPTAVAFQPGKLWEVVGALLFLFTASYRALTDTYDFLFWFGTCVGIGAAGLAIYWRGRPQKAPYALPPR